MQSYRASFKDYRIPLLPQLKKVILLWFCNKVGLFTISLGSRLSNETLKDAALSLMPKRKKTQSFSQTLSFNTKLYTNKLGRYACN
jgi:hypothetical protein